MLYGQGLIEVTFTGNPVSLGNTMSGFNIFSTIFGFNGISCCWGGAPMELIASSSCRGSGSI